MYAYDNGSMVGTGERASAVLRFPRAIVKADRRQIPSGYGARNGPNWAVIGTIAALHVLGLVALVKMDIVSISKPKNAPLVVDLIAEPPAPPPETKRRPKQETRVQPRIITPAPIVQTVAPPPIITTTAVAPPRPIPVAQPAPPPPASVAASNLDDSVIDGKPPKYPLESLRKKEQGTVMLRLTIGTNGSVSSISVAKSSGFDRLDDAALRAVRLWRWRPMVRDGQALEVMGVMAIPFVMKG
jgi:protein TonB